MPLLETWQPILPYEKKRFYPGLDLILQYHLSINLPLFLCEDYITYRLCSFFLRLKVCFIKIRTKHSSLVQIFMKQTLMSKKWEASRMHDRFSDFFYNQNFSFWNIKPTIVCIWKISLHVIQISDPKRKSHTVFFYDFNIEE